MKLTSQVLGLTSLGLLAISAFSGTQAMAYYRGGYHGGYENGYNRGANDAAGSLAAALISSYSLLTTADANRYNSETLQVEAAAYLDTGAKGAVFEAFASRMAEEMSNQTGGQAIEADALNTMIAQHIIDSAE